MLPPVYLAERFNLVFRPHPLQNNLVFSPARAKPPTNRTAFSSFIRHHEKSPKSVQKASGCFCLYILRRDSISVSSLTRATSPNSETRPSAAPEKPEAVTVRAALAPGEERGARSAYVYQRDQEVKCAGRLPLPSQLQGGAASGGPAMPQAVIIGAALAAGEEVSRVRYEG